MKRHRQSEHVLPACDIQTPDTEEKNTRTTFTKVEEVIYQASAKNSRQRQLLIQDTPQDINIKNIMVF